MCPMYLAKLLLKVVTDTTTPSLSADADANRGELDRERVPTQYSY